jgi:predicted permease
MGKSLVVLEVALAIVLVTGAGLLLKSYARALGSDLGFDSEGLVTANYWFPSSRYQDNAQVQGFIDQVTTRLEARPEISGLAMASMVPIREYGSNFTEIGVDGRDATASFVETRSVSPGYFGIMDIALLRGRIFTEVEANDRAPVVVINRTLARQLFGDDDPTGWRLAAGNATPEIIGVVDDVRDFGPDRVPRPTMYFPSVLAANLMVRSAADLATVTNLLRSAARDADPGVVLIRVQTMDAILDQALSGRRFQLTLIGTFALTALVLACVGIYGVLSYSVERQTREIGVRMALGARAAAVATRVAWRGGKLAITGVVLGGVGAYALRETIASQLFNVESFDPLVYLGVGALLLGVAAIACLVPARRAAIIDPVRALHAE